MIDRILTVSGFTLLSRISGFLRDIVLAWLLGAGPIADAFFVALRLPNHFRAIFAEGAFNAASCPPMRACIKPVVAVSLATFADRIFTLLLASQVVLLAIALLFTPWVDSCWRRDLVKDLLRSGPCGRSDPDHLSVPASGRAGNALRRHSQRARPFCNGCGCADPAQHLYDRCAFAGDLFPDAGTRGGLGRIRRGCLEALLVGGDAWRQGVLPRLRWPRFDVDVKAFLKRFAPATVGSAETQIALFADTIIASLLATGALSSLYYADRINQLPIGVIVDCRRHRTVAGDGKSARCGR
jgi:putative peptidoglycan lipid II flippase